jgi:hypothetical protein
MQPAYAGMKVGQVNRQFGDEQIIQQGLIAKALIKGWSAEHKEELRKYNALTMSLKKRTDGINEWLEDKGPIPYEEVQRIEREFNKRCETANRLMKALVADYKEKMTKAGVTTSLGYNFYDLRGPSYLIYPVNTPIINELPRWGKVNAGYGTMVHWKYTSIGPGNGTNSQQYAGAAEGKRVGTSLPNENDGVAQYSEFGVERSVSFTAEFAGEGYTDNVADEHLRGLQTLKLQEESICIGGNQGAGTNQNGFALGTANTPSLSLAASIPSTAPSDLSTSGFSNSTSVSVRVVELTMLGYPNNGQYGYQAAPTVGATGLVPTYSRTDAGPYTDTDTINGGMGQISAASAVSTAITSTPYVKASVVPKKGAFAWAWFVNTTDATTPTTANSFLSVITQVPYVYLGTLSSSISANQAGSATGLNGDHSAQGLDTSGIIAWAAAQGVFLNMSDISKTDPATGATYNGLLQPTELGTQRIPNILQLDYDLRQQWNAYQTVADELWCSADVKLYLNNAILAGGASAYKFNMERDGQGNILGGSVVSGYKSIYSMQANGAEEMAIRLHPMLPPGTYLLHKTKNPYAHSRLPGVSGMFVQRDYYGIEWPVNKRQWEFGTYVHECYANYIPGLLTVRTGIQGVSTT